MQKPTPQTFGLTYEDVAASEPWERWVNRGPLIGMIAGGVCGVLIGGICGFLYGGPRSDIYIGWASLLGLGGSIFGTAIFDTEVVKAAIARLNPNLSRVRRFHWAVTEAEERERRRRSEFWLTLPGHAFERELAVVFKRNGYEVTQTPGSGDGGIDLMLRKAGRRIAVQCKQTKLPVGPGAARDLYGAVIHCGADEGILATTGGVTSGVHAFFKGKPLRVMDLTQILALHSATGNR